MHTIIKITNSGQLQNYKTLAQREEEARKQSTAVSTVKKEESAKQEVELVVSNKEVGVSK